ncbi:hypothetical protein [uncultured Lutibacter sp.]|nr:hypothetical protein [uncultured Lutibacter sp.]
MKKLKLIFGLLLVAGFFATIALSNSTSDDQAIRKDRIIIPRNG